MKKILVLGNYKDAMYHPLTGVDNELQTIFPDMQLLPTEDTSALLSLTDNKIDGIISYLDIWESTIPTEESDALYDFILNGGALLILHNGISLQNTAMLKTMIGAAFITHPAHEEITFSTVKNSFLGDFDSFTLDEEPYQFEMLEDDKEIILEYTYQNKTYPAGWFKNFGKGKLIFLTPGHTAKIFTCPEYQAIIHTSMTYCLEE